MKIRDYLELLKLNPKAFKIIGKGGRCLALVHNEHPNQVLLLESAKESSTSPDEDAALPTPDRAHARSVTFAKMYDRYIEAGLKGIRNQKDAPFIHSSLLDSLDTVRFRGPYPLHIGKGKYFNAYSARLICMIPGKALHYLDFVGPEANVTPKKADRIAKDLAKWLYTLHHNISDEAYEKNNIEKQFDDAGINVSERFVRSRKYNVFVDLNLKEIQVLKKNLKDGTMRSDIRENLTHNMTRAGVNFDLLVSAAALLTNRLSKTLPLDRFGLTHSDVHPANVIVDPDYTSVNGVCDWMTGTMDAQSVDFAGLGLAHGLLPKVVKHYEVLEKERGDERIINKEALYAYAAMRQIFITIKNTKNTFNNGSCIARVAWEQVGECIMELAKINHKKYECLAKKFRRLKFPEIHIPAERKQFQSRPSNVCSPKM
jgi:hypothetical protein